MRCLLFLLSLLLSLIATLFASFIMSKSKNHTAKNQNKKAHRNGLKRPTTHRFQSQKGRDAKFMKNLRFSKTGSRKAKLEAEKAK